MRILFLPSDPKYANEFLEYRLDPITRKFNPLLNQSLDDLKLRLSEACSDLKLFESKDTFAWYISFNDKIIGTATIQTINLRMLTAEIGYGVFAEYRGKGFATQIVQQLTSNIFSQTNLRKLIAYVHEQNIPSRRVLEKVGFVQEGILREHYIVEGIPVNEVIYGILRHEFS
jgi:ribosomal-protein-alanine N-acetyltransferase